MTCTFEGVNDDEEDDVDSVSADATNQWPPQAPQKPPTLINTTATPLPKTEVIESSGIENNSRRSVSPSLYQETIDIERSRPSSPVSELERQQPLLIDESVVKYLETGHKPQERPRSGRKLKGLDREPQENLSESVSELVKPVDEEVKPVETQVKKPDEKQNIVNEKQLRKPVKQEEKQEKPVSKPVKQVQHTDTQNGTKNTEQTHDFSKKISSAQQPEPRKDYINIVLNKPKPPVQLDQLGSQRVGKESDDHDGLSSVSSISATQHASFLFSEPQTPKKEKEVQKKPEEPAKNDLSDLAALISRNKSAKVAKEKVSRNTFGFGLR